MASIQGAVEQYKELQDQLLGTLDLMERQLKEQPDSGIKPVIRINLDGMDPASQREIYRTALTYLQYEATVFRNMGVVESYFNRIRKAELSAAKLTESMGAKNKLGFVDTAIMMKVHHHMQRFEEQTKGKDLWSIGSLPEKELKALVYELEELDNSQFSEEEKKVLEGEVAEWKVLIEARLGDKRHKKFFEKHSQLYALEMAGNLEVVKRIFLSIYESEEMRFCDESIVPLLNCARMIVQANLDYENFTRNWSEDSRHTVTNLTIKHRLSAQLVHILHVWDRTLGERKKVFNQWKKALEDSFGKKRVEYLKFAKVQIRSDMLTKMGCKESLSEDVLTPAVEVTKKEVNNYFADYCEADAASASTSVDPRIERIREHSIKPPKTKSKKKKSRPNNRKGKEPASAEMPRAEKKVRKIIKWKLDFGENAQEQTPLPGKPFKGFFHDRVARWRSVEDHTRISSDPKFPEYKGSSNTRYAHAIHAFSSVIDRFAEYGFQHQSEGSEYFILPAEMQLDTKTYKGMISWARNSQGVVYHRCFQDKELAEVMEKIRKKSFLQEDLAHIEKGETFAMPKGKENSTQEGPRGETLSINPVLGTVTVVDSKLQATFRLIPVSPLLA